MPFISSQGASIHYQIKGKGVPLIFIHPPAMGAATFYEQRWLARDFCTVMMDARGHGYSSSGKGTLTVEEWAQDICNLVDELELGRVVLCGYSCGGSVALEFALRWPEKTAGVVLAGGFPVVCTTLLRQEFETGIWICNKGWLGLLGRMLSVANSHKEQHEQAIYNTVRTSHAPLLSSIYTSALHYSCTATLSQLEAPLLLIYGSRDWYVHYYQYLFYKYAVRAPKDVVFVSGIGHQVPTLTPDSYNAIVSRFVRENFGGQAPAFFTQFVPNKGNQRRELEKELT
ncbi:alpha/beta fold hydrolase [Alteribacillus sp. HJP-4]|uniref:alpha/beta fold hydrolase n=1 Tax=Alteribacillus sp. HJP-4 TaxID=2775394 RepID=UPI0035CCFAEA